METWKKKCKKTSNEIENNGTELVYVTLFEYENISK